MNSTEFLDLLSSSLTTLHGVSSSPLTSASSDSRNGSPAVGARSQVISFSSSEDDYEGSQDDLSCMWKNAKRESLQGGRALHMCSGDASSIASDGATMYALRSRTNRESTVSTESTSCFSSGSGSSCLLICENAPLELPGIDELVDAVVEEEEPISQRELRNWTSEKFLKERIPEELTVAHELEEKPCSELENTERASFAPENCKESSEGAIRVRVSDMHISSESRATHLTLDSSQTSLVSKDRDRDRALSLPTESCTDIVCTPLSENHLDPTASFSESFARRKNRTSHRSSASNRHTHSSFESAAHASDVGEFVKRAGKELAELLDQNHRVANRMTAGTRQFAACFTFEEKRVFGAIVRIALDVVEREDRSVLTRSSTDSFSGLGRWNWTKTDRATSSLGFRSVESVEGRELAICQSSQMPSASKKEVASVAVAKRAVFGCTDMPEPQQTRTSPLLQRKLSLSPSERGKSNCRTNVTSSVPLMTHITNERFDVQLPFGSALLAVLAVLSRIDCDLIYKQRKNKKAPYVRDFKTRHTTIIYVHTRNNDACRPFIFSVVVSGSSSTRIAFHRPMFLCSRRVDEYVDTVCDSKEYLAEYIHAMWGRNLC